MKPLIALALAALVSSAATAEAASGRVYAGREAAALKCAAYFAHVPSTLAESGLASTEDRIIGREVGLYILDRHVSGTWEQKLHAYGVILGRMPRSDIRLVGDFARHIDWCIREFG